MLSVTVFLCWLVNIQTKMHSLLWLVKRLITNFGFIIAMKNNTFVYKQQCHKQKYIFGQACKNPVGQLSRYNFCNVPQCHNIKLSPYPIQYFLPCNCHQQEYWIHINTTNTAAPFTIKHMSTHNRHSLCPMKTTKQFCSDS